VLRGLKTLAVRMRQHSPTPSKVGCFLEQHPNVKRVYYPGLASHPSMSWLGVSEPVGFGGMLSFESWAALRRPARLRDAPGSSLSPKPGGVESLIELPALMTHASLPARGVKRSASTMA